MVFAESRSAKLPEKAVSKINFVKFQITEGIYLKEMVPKGHFLEIVMTAKLALKLSCEIPCLVRKDIRKVRPGHLPCFVD